MLHFLFHSIFVFYECFLRSLSKLDLVFLLKRNFVYYAHAKVVFHVLMTNLDFWHRYGVHIYICLLYTSPSPRD